MPQTYVGVALVLQYDGSYIAAGIKTGEDYMHIQVNMFIPSPEDPLVVATRRCANPITLDQVDGVGQDIIKKNDPAKLAAASQALARQRGFQLR